MPFYHTSGCRDANLFSASMQKEYLRFQKTETMKNVCTWLIFSFISRILREQKQNFVKRCIFVKEYDNSLLKSSLYFLLGVVHIMSRMYWYKTFVYCIVQFFVIFIMRFLFSVETHATQFSLRVCMIAYLELHWSQILEIFLATRWKKKRELNSIVNTKKSFTQRRRWVLLRCLIKAIFDVHKKRPLFKPHTLGCISSK
jgi:hypothetical protein